MALKLLADAIKERKGDIRVLIVSLGELKSGNSDDGSTWQRQEATIKDNSSAMTMQLWNKDIGKLLAGKFYEIANPYWNEYKNKVQLSLGNYAQIAEIDESEMLPFDGEVQDHTPKQSKGVDFQKLQSDAAPTQSKPSATDEERLDFAETALIRFINTIKENEIDPLKAVEQFGAVYNTALMNKK